MLFISSRQIGLHALGELAAGQHDAMPAALTFQANIGAEPHDGPLVRATWMRFAQAQQVVELEIGEHLW